MAAYCARRRLEVDVSRDEMEDMIQSAALVYWKHLRAGMSAAYCFVAARDAAETYYYRQILGRGPRRTISLDAPVHDDGDLPHEWLAAPVPVEDARTIDWLSDEVLEGVLYEARHVAGFEQRKITRYWATIQNEKRIIRLAARGHTNESIATMLGTTEGTIRPLAGICDNRRQRIRRLLESLLPAGAPPVEYDRRGGHHATARAIQLTYPQARRPEPM